MQQKQERFSTYLLVYDTLNFPLSELFGKLIGFIISKKKLKNYNYGCFDRM